MIWLVALAAACCFIWSGVYALVAAMEQPPPGASLFGGRLLYGVLGMMVSGMVLGGCLETLL